MVVEDTVELPEAGYDGHCILWCGRPAGNPVINNLQYILPTYGVKFMEKYYLNVPPSGGSFRAGSIINISCTILYSKDIKFRSLNIVYNMSV
jgi:hypothetical protein